MQSRNQIWARAVLKKPKCNMFATSRCCRKLFCNIFVFDSFWLNNNWVTFLLKQPTPLRVKKWQRSQRKSSILVSQIEKKSTNDSHFDFFLPKKEGNKKKNNTWRWKMTVLCCVLCKRAFAFFLFLRKSDSHTALECGKRLRCWLIALRGMKWSFIYLQSAYTRVWRAVLSNVEQNIWIWMNKDGFALNLIWKWFLDEKEGLLVLLNWIIRFLQIIHELMAYWYSSALLLFYKLWIFGYRCHNLKIIVSIIIIAS